MKQLTKIKVIRFSEEMEYKLNELKKYSFKETDFIRLAVQEKLERDLPELENKYQKENNKIFCPF